MWAIAIAVAALYTSTEAEIYYQMPFVMPRPFLDKLPWRAASEFYGLIAARNITHRATRQKVQEWGEKYGVKEEMNKFYNKYQKNEEERGKKAIALLENAAKAYREYLALHDDTKTPEQIGADEKKMRYQIPKEYTVFAFASKVANLPSNIWLSDYQKNPILMNYLLS
ncbi:hypothetical protein ANCCAN_13225 [Ancylostoma caninum]|uniref:SXP/RAL-2 family protein Ani s 5-like cation-binding domain-containing protein n=1 Tax=Ancylostoma caninum TaxID=29170 RepID=A0A368G8X4_ANCCA|nr:hypothetical protein ANCCAN_13225 [Ancylostoma caninum]